MNIIKKLAIGLIGLLGLLTTSVSAQSIPTISPWYYTNSSTIRTVNNPIVQIPRLGSSGSPCLIISNASGTVATSTCGGVANIVFKANGSAFVTTSTIDFQAGSNITITTSSAGVYTITGSAGGGSGSVTTSSAVTTNNFPFWVTVGGGLSGTSTLTTSGGILTQSSDFNILGTASSSQSRLASSTLTRFTVNGDTFTDLTGSGLSVSSNILNVSGLSTSNFTSSNISQWTNDSGYVTSTGANPSASLGLSAVNGSANTFMRSDGAPALSQSITPTWSGSHNFSVGLTGTSTLTWGGNINSTGTVRLDTLTANRIVITDASKNLISGGAGITCGAGDFLNVLSATGTATCATPATGLVNFQANGSAFVTTSTIGFTAGSNVTITTSTAGVYTIASTGGAGGGVATTTVFSAGYLTMVSSSLAISNSLLFNDVTNSRIGLGTIIPSSTLHLVGGQLWVSSSTTPSSKVIKLFHDGTDGRIDVGAAAGGGISIPSYIGVGVAPASGVAISGYDGSGHNGKVRLGSASFYGDIQGNHSAGFVDFISNYNTVGYRFYGSNSNDFFVQIQPDDKAIYLGLGKSNASASSIAYRGLVSATNGTGADNGGGTLVIAGGRSTGSAAGGSLFFQTTAAGSSGSSLNTTSTRMVITSAGLVGIGNTSPSSTLHITGNVQLSGSSTVATPSIGGGLLTAATCATATSSIDASVTSSSAAFDTSPQNYPGDGIVWDSYLSAPGVLTTRVCAIATLTPAATVYNVKIFK